MPTDIQKKLVELFEKRAELHVKASELRLESAKIKAEMLRLAQNDPVGVELLKNLRIECW